MEFREGVPYRSQPTYKEWKFAYEAIQSIGLVVFPAYLQGMERGPAGFRNRRYHTFPAYLQGMESSALVAPSTLGSRFPAYLQGMERVFARKGWEPLTAFPAYLQGMES